MRCGDGCPVPIDAAPRYQCTDQSLITAVGKSLGCCVVTAFQPKLSQLSATALSARCAQRWDRNLQLPLTPLSEALLFGGIRLGVQKVQWQPYPAGFTTDRGTWLRALSCSWLQHHLSHQSRVCGSLLPATPGSHSRSLPLECHWLLCSELSPVITSKAWTPTALDTARHPLPYHVHRVTPDPEAPAAPKPGQSSWDRDLFSEVPVVPRPCGVTQALSPHFQPVPVDPIPPWATCRCGAGIAWPWG